MRAYNRSSKQIADDFLKRREKARQVAEEVAAEKARQVAEEAQQQTRRIKLLRRNRWLKRHRRWLKIRGNATALAAAAEKARQVAEEVAAAQQALLQQQLAAMRRKATAERQAMIERALISKTEGWDNPSSPGSSEEGSYHNESLPAEGKYHGESSDAQSSDIQETLRTVIARSSSSKDGQPADASTTTKQQRYD
jgi:hypothetical protein